MFPLRDTLRSRRFPLVNWLLIGANVAVFLYEVSLGAEGLDRFFGEYALIPAQLSLAAPVSLLSLVTSMFLHGGWFHVISNLWTLVIFGDNVEDRMGSFRYLVFYLAAGVFAGLVQVVFAPGSSIPTVGASGAIAGVLGAYLLLFPHGRVLTFIPLFILPWLVETVQSVVDVPLSLDTTNRYAELTLRAKAAALRACEPACATSAGGRSNAVWKDDKPLLDWLNAL